MQVVNTHPDGEVTFWWLSMTHALEVSPPGNNNVAGKSVS